MIFHPRLSERSPRRDVWYPEVRQAPGPIAIGSPGGDPADLISTAWFTAVDAASGVLELRRLGGGEWHRVTVPGHPVIDQQLPIGVRRVGVAFDEVAQPVVCWELGGMVRVARRDAGTHEELGPWPGVDPFVANDIWWSEGFAPSDVILFYLSPDRKSLRYRIEQEDYATEHVLYAFDEAMVFDQIVPQDFKYAAMFTTISADEKITLVSESYPAPTDNIELPSDAVTVSVTLIGGGSYVRT